MQFKPMPASIFQEKKFPISTLTIAITLAGLSHSVLAQDVIQVSASPSVLKKLPWLSKLM